MAVQRIVDQYHMIMASFAFVAGLSLVCVLIVNGAILQQSQQTIDAVQDQQIAMATRQTDANAAKLELLEAQIFEIKASIDRMNGIGIGFGSLLSGLLALDMFFRARNNRAH